MVVVSFAESQVSEDTMMVLEIPCVYVYFGDVETFIRVHGEGGDLL